MKHIPFADLSPAERQALMEVLQRCGVPLRQVCVSRTDPAPEEACSVATVTAGSWSRSYPAHAGWIAELERDLAGVTPPAAPAP
jgi:hypothetical protein